MYQHPDKSIWTGRQDNSGDELWHQVMGQLSLDKPVSKVLQGIALLGFASDEGVRRNQGRTGAKDGPDALRRAMCNLAVHFNPGRVKLCDAGNVTTVGEDLECAQQELAEKVKQLLDAGYFPILLGGGHEIAYGHYTGISSHLEGSGKKIGIINFDAHFDLRSYEKGPHSGSPFRQIADDCESASQSFHYLPIGISQASNTRYLFAVMDALGQGYILAQDITDETMIRIASRIYAFINSVDHVYVTLDLDVIASAFVGGVSAPAPFGLFPHQVRELLRAVLETGKVISLDIAEFNPAFDDGRTAKIAASLVYEIVMNKISR